MPISANKMPNDKLQSFLSLLCEEIVWDLCCYGVTIGTMNDVIAFVKSRVFMEKWIMRYNSNVLLDLRTVIWSSIGCLTTPSLLSGPSLANQFLHY